MNALLRRGITGLPLIAFLCLPAGTASAQVISIKTVPVTTGDQFLIIPSRNLGMGGVSIALDDPLIDPFINPAKGRKVEGVKLFGGSSFYTISEDNGSGRTLPLAVLFSTGRWFGGAAGAIQQLVPASPTFSWPWFGPINPPTQTPYRGQLPVNRYGFGTLGTKLPGGRIAVGVSVAAADLEAVDGVELLYARSLQIKQYGNSIDYRLGLSGDLSGDRSFEILLLHNRVNMTHDVTYLDILDPPVNPPIDPFPIPPVPPFPTVRKRNLDHSNTTGLHLGYVQPMKEDGWRIGGIITGNWKSHPKIPEYELTDMAPIPRDPGNSWAYNLGIGLSRLGNLSAFGIDFVYEPIWTETWGEAAEPIITAGGTIIPVGGKTVENDFRFNNILIRIGTSWKHNSGRFQLGLQLKSVHYELDQLNNVEGFTREQKESWIEWTPSWGANLVFPEFQINYVGRLTAGTGRPGNATGWIDSRGAAQFGDSLASGDFLVAPTGALALQEAEVWTHQVYLVVPIRF
jgi:hypothetical protein